jgi:hypothetical protein
MELLRNKATLFRFQVYGKVNFCSQAAMQNYRLISEEPQFIISKYHINKLEKSVSSFGAWKKSQAKSSINAEVLL